MKMKGFGAEACSVTCTWCSRARGLEWCLKHEGEQRSAVMVRPYTKDSCSIRRWRFISGDWVCREEPVGRINEETKRERALDPKHQLLYFVAVRGPILRP